MNPFFRFSSTRMYLRKLSCYICHRHWLLATLLSAGLLGNVCPSRGEAMLELFQMTWPQITQKMPEIAEAGYDSLWVPNPAKGNSGAYSIGYDPFDPFDLGSTNQQGTIATAYGTQAQLIQMVQTAHRFGIRVYFDNVMNHRSSHRAGLSRFGHADQLLSRPDSAGFSFADRFRRISKLAVRQRLVQCPECRKPAAAGFVRSGARNRARSIGILAPVIGNTITKPVFIRFPEPAGFIHGHQRPVAGHGWGGDRLAIHSTATASRCRKMCTTYLCRAVAWTLYTTKCDGFRLDAVKHVPVNFFGNETGQTDDPSFAGYTGAIQAMYDYVHGYGSNVTGNGYVRNRRQPQQPVQHRGAAQRRDDFRRIRPVGAARPAMIFTIISIPACGC